MPRILYWMEESPPCSAVVLLAKNLGVELSLKPIILFSAEKNPDLLKANPQHLVPTLDDDGFILAER
ncbi:unnamed protein product, partial [Timema podura]|nr:unnamed protein product [Timema podura]